MIQRTDDRVRRGWFLGSLAVFAVWLGVLTWMAWATGRRPREAAGTVAPQAEAAARGTVEAG